MDVLNDSGTYTVHLNLETEVFSKQKLKELQLKIRLYLSLESATKVKFAPFCSP